MTCRHPIVGNTAKFGGVLNAAPAQKTGVDTGVKTKMETGKKTRVKIGMKSVELIRSNPMAPAKNWHAYSGLQSNHRKDLRLTIKSEAAYQRAIVSIIEGGYEVFARREEIYELWKQ